MHQSDSKKKRLLHTERSLIIEMIEAAMQKAQEKGPHPLAPGCNCIACSNKRKRILEGPPKPWLHRL